MERALVSYDDIQGPAHSVMPAPVAGPSASPSHQQNQPGQPPRKKRRNNKQNRGGGGGNNHQQNSNVNGFNGGGYSGNGWGNRQQQQQQYAHWDDPGGAAQSYPPQPAHPQLPPKPQTSLPAKPIPTGPRERVGPVQEEYYEEEGAEDEEGEGEEEMSRMLTREEIWDDSALIDAWDSAMAEYEAMHGQSRAWKDEPVKKWYNVPPKPAPSKPDPQPEPATESTDSQPFDFNTFVPSHDPSLGGPDAAYAHGTVAGFANAGADGEVAWAGRDAAFGQAMSAMYWAGYWTAVYHSHNRVDANPTTRAAEGEDVDGEYAGEEGEEDDEDEAVVASPVDEDIIPTQR